MILKKILLMSFTLIYATSLLAQIEFGISVGTNISKMNGEFDYYQTKNQVGFQTGLLFNYAITEDEVLNLRTGFFFIQKGGKINYTLESSGSQWILNGIQRINFIEFPLSLYIINKVNQKSNILFSIGFFYARGVGGKLKLENNYTNFEYPGYSRIVNYEMPMEFVDIITYDHQDGRSSFEEEYGFIKKEDLGIRFSVGYEIKNLAIELIYSAGLESINPHEEGVTSDEIGKTTQCLQVCLSYFFKTRS